MARRTRLVMICAALLTLAPGAHAGTLTSATWYQVTGVGAGQISQGIPLTRTGAQLGITGTSTSTSIAVNLSYPFTALTLFVPKTPSAVVDLAVQATLGGPQQIIATTGMAGGSPGVPGTVIIMTAAHLSKGVNQSQFKVGTNTIVAVPMSVGKAGQFTGTFSALGQYHVMTVDFHAWTPNTIAFTGLTSKGYALPDVTVQGSFNLTAAQGFGTVTLVSPSKISIDGTLLQRRTVTFTKLAMSFVPEPGTLLLLGAAGALSLAGRRAGR